MSIKIKQVEVIYQDGREATYPIIPAAIVEAEGYATHLGMTTAKMPYESTLYAAWSVARKKETDIPDFKSWVQSLVAVEETEGQGVSFRGNDSNSGDSSPVSSDTN